MTLEEGHDLSSRKSHWFNNSMTLRKDMAFPCKDSSWKTHRFSNSNALRKDMASSTLKMRWACRTRKVPLPGVTD